MNENRKLEIDKINFDRIQKSEEEKRKKYNPDKLFKNKTPIQQNQPVQQEFALVKVKENFFTKVIKKLKNIFHIK